MIPPRTGGSTPVARSTSWTPCATPGVPAIVFSSTAAVYGTPEQIPIAEDAPLEPINPYGASKLAAERAVASYADAYGLAYAALRYFNVAGASGEIGEDHRPETHLIPSALDAAAGWREPLSVFGNDFPTADGTAIRDYVHVEDLIDAHLLALDRVVAGGNSLGAINLGTRGGASVREVLDAVERVTGVPVPELYAGRRPGDPAILVADASRANASSRLAAAALESLTKWSPRPGRGASDSPAAMTIAASADKLVLGRSHRGEISRVMSRGSSAAVVPSSGATPASPALRARESGQDRLPETPLATLQEPADVPLVAK